MEATVYVTTNEDAEVEVSQIIYRRLGLPTGYDGTEYNDDGTATHEYTVEYRESNDIDAVRRLLDSNGEIIKIEIEF